MMVEDPKVRLAGAARGRSRRDRQLRGLRAPHHGGVDGGADPSLQDGDAGRARSRRARSTKRWSRRAASSRFYVVSDGEHRPYRVKIRDPSFVNLQATPLMVEGHLIADAIAAIASIDPGDGGRGPLMPLFEDATLDEARTIMARYPDGRERSAIMPLLYLAQSVEGRVTRAGPAGGGGTARADDRRGRSRRELLHHDPPAVRPARHVVSVCTNLSCALRGSAQTCTRRRTGRPASRTARSSPRTASSRSTRRSASARARRLRSSRSTSCTTTTSRRSAWAS